MTGFVLSTIQTRPPRSQTNMRPVVEKVTPTASFQVPLARGLGTLVSVKLPGSVAATVVAAMSAERRSPLQIIPTALTSRPSISLKLRFPNSPKV